MNDINTKEIKRVINEILSKEDKNHVTYLILRLEGGEAIFVFQSEVSKEKWDELEEGKEYTFSVREGFNGSNLLVSFKTKSEETESEF